MGKPAATIRKRRSFKGRSTRLAILSAARTVFAREGFTRAEIGQIAEEAGKGRGTFYLYFDSKAALLDAMIALFLEDMRGVSGLSISTHSPEEVETFLRVLWATFADHAATFRAMADAAIIHPEFGKKYRRIRSFAALGFAQMIRRRQAEGACIGLDAELAGRALETMINTGRYDWLAPDQIEWSNKAEEARAFQTLLFIVRATLELSPKHSAAAPGRKRAGKP